MELDAHARPPENLRLSFKRWQKCTIDEIQNNSDILDTRKSPSDPRLRLLNRSVEQVHRLFQALHRFTNSTIPDYFLSPQFLEVKSLPGAHAL